MVPCKTLRVLALAGVLVWAFGGALAVADGGAAQNVQVTVYGLDGQVLTDATVVAHGEAGKLYEPAVVGKGTFIFNVVGEKIAFEVQHPTYGLAKVDAVLPTASDALVAIHLDGQTASAEVRSPAGANKPHFAAQSSGGQQPLDSAALRRATTTYDVRQGGDTCATATVIASLPYSATGTTAGYTNDYDEICPYSGSTAPDVVYEYTPAANVSVDISLCTNSAYDTKLYVYQGSCPGTVVGCNDDACSTPSYPSSYVSELTGVSLTAGNTYYIIVDGYGTASGNYTIDVTLGTPPPQCPPDSLYGQNPNTPSESWVFGVADTDFNLSSPPNTNGIKRWDDFSGVTGDICDLHWWGVRAWNSGAGFVQCSEDPMAFNIEFYTDAGGMPGTLACSYNVVKEGTPTGVLFSGFEMYEWSITLDPCCSLDSGWVSITGGGDDPTCWFLWAAQTPGDGYGSSLIDETNGTGIAVETFNLAFCLTPASEGACCDDSVPVCYDGYTPAECDAIGGRFAAGQACDPDPFDPPCGSGLGACCDYDGNCTLTLPEDCTGPGEVYHAGMSCAEVDCVGACCLPGGDCQELTEAACADMGGVFQGFAVTCTPNPCVGACCHADATCDLVESDAECTGADDLWLGLGSTCDQCPCIVPCPPGSNTESEPCGSDTNGGCNMATPAFEPIACGETVCGTIYATTSLRDTDWYEVVVTEPTIFTWTVKAEFDVVVGLIEMTAPGSGDCADSTGYLSPYALAGPCEEASVTTDCLPPGTHWFFVSHQDFPNFPCDGNNDYVATLTCEACVLPTGACCLSDGSCQDNTYEGECAGLGGLEWHEGLTCAEVTCPQPPPNDKCETAEPLSVPGSVIASNQLADDDNMPTCGTSSPGHGMWYVVEGTGNTMTATTCSANTTFDTKIQVFCDCDDLVCVGGNDDSTCTYSGLHSTFSWCSAVGQFYYIHVGGYSTNVGTFELIVSDGAACSPPVNCQPPIGACCVDTDCVGDMTLSECTGLGGDWFDGESCATFVCPQPVPETCEEAFVIPSVPFSTTFDNNLSTADGPPGSCNTSSATVMQNDAWFSYTPPEDCSLTLSVNTTTYDGIIAIYTGPDCNNLTEVACLDEPDNPATWSTNATAGTTYWFQVGDWGTSEGGGITTFDLDCTVGTGACCYRDGTCDDLTEVDCAAAGGDFQGSGTDCATTTCPVLNIGDDCNTPIVVTLPADLPYADLGQTTCGRLDDYNTTCMGSYDGGEDIIYQLNVTEQVCVTITLDADNIWGGLGLDDECPLAASGCIATATTSANPDVISEITLPPGVYYLMADTYPTPYCINFDLTIDPCPVSGACCKADGSCEDLTLAECDAAGGNYQGDYTECATTVCPQPGACCVDSSCIVTLKEDCEAQGGVFIGEGESCGGGAGNPQEYVANPNVAIPDADAGGVMDTMTVPDSFVIGDVDVDLTIDHTWQGDLCVTLEHNGTTVALIKRMNLDAECDVAGCCGCSTDNLAGIILDDEGTGGPIETQCVADLTSPPNYTPEEALSAFDGMDSAGDWTLWVNDNAAGDTGTLVQWSLHIDSQGVNPCECGECPPGTIPLTDGQGDFAGWCLSVSHPTWFDIFVDDVDRPAGEAYIQLSKDFMDPPGFGGLITPILVDFVQVCPDALTADQIFIVDEAITNLTGVPWLDFHWILFDAPEAWFDTLNSNFDTSPFMTSQFENFVGPDMASKLNAFDGVLPDGASFFPGNGLGELVIGVDLGGEDPVSFTLKERPTLEGFVYLAVGSNVPSASVAVSPQDVYGDADGAATFTRFYQEGAQVTLTAPQRQNGKPFKQWVVDGVPQTARLRTIDVTLSADTTVTALYGTTALPQLPVEKEDLVR